MATRRRSSKSVAAPVKKSTPPTPNLTFNDYKEDFKIRLEIHNYEVNVLIDDVKKGYAIASPYVKQATNHIVKTFNQVRERLQTVD